MFGNILDGLGQIFEKICDEAASNDASYDELMKQFSYLSRDIARLQRSIDKLSAITGLCTDCEQTGDKGVPTA